MRSEPPDVVGFPLDRARALLDAAGAVVVKVERTQPPRTPLVGDLRVVRQRGLPDGVELVACAERYVHEQRSHGRERGTP